MSLLTLTGIAGARGGRMLFEGIDLSVGAGAAVAVGGANGSGKTTLLRIAAGLLAPVAGTAVRSGRIAWLGEAAALDGERTLVEALAFWARADGPGRTAARVADGLAAMDLTELAGVPVRFLSTGQRRRAALARVVASDAALWLLDEPTNGLDTAARAALEAAIATRRATGGAVVAASHQSLAMPGAVTVQLG